MKLLKYLMVSLMRKVNTFIQIILFNLKIYTIYYVLFDLGASIIRMMDHFLTTEVFKRGLTNYLNEK